MQKEQRLFRFMSFGALLFMLLSTVVCAEQYNETDPNYQPEPDAIILLQKVDQPTEIVLFHGTWCKDCQREIPRFNKVLKSVNNPNITVTEYEVNPQKKDLLGKFEEYGIASVPTFIVIRDGKELGRIIETPKMSLEEDLAAILTQDL